MIILVAAAFPADSNYANALNTIKIADGFDKLGYEVHLVCRNPTQQGFKKDDLIEKFALRGNLKVHFLPNWKWVKRFNTHEVFGWQVQQLSKKIRPDFA